MNMENVDINKFAKEFVGKPLSTVEFVARNRNIKYRFASIDGSRGLLSADVNIDRANLTIEKGVVTKITAG